MLLSCKTQILIWQLSLKAQVIIWHYFHKAQIIIWQLFLQKPKSILATIPTKAQSLFWQLFHKAQNTILAKKNYFTLKTQTLFWHIFTKCKYYFDTCFTYTKSHTHGKYKYSSLKKYLSYKIYKNPWISLMAKLFIL